MCIQHRYVTECLDRGTRSFSDLIGPSRCYGEVNIRDGLYVAASASRMSWSSSCHGNVVWRLPEVT